jgi:hypothetical protein
MAEMIVQDIFTLPMRLIAQSVVMMQCCVAITNAFYWQIGVMVFWIVEMN